MKVRDLIEKLNEIEDDEMEIFVAPMIEMTHLSGDSEENKTSLIPSPFSRFKLKVMTISGIFGADALSDSFLLFGYDDSRSYRLSEITGVEDAGDHIN